MARGKLNIGKAGKAKVKKYAKQAGQAKGTGMGSRGRTAKEVAKVREILKRYGGNQ